MAYKEKDTIKVKTHVQSTHNKNLTIDNKYGILRLS